MLSKSYTLGKIPVFCEITKNSKLLFSFYARHSHLIANTNFSKRGTMPQNFHSPFMLIAFQKMAQTKNGSIPNKRVLDEIFSTPLVQRTKSTDTKKPTRTRRRKVCITRISRTTYSAVIINSPFLIFKVLNSNGPFLTYFEGSKNLYFADENF